MLEPVRCLPIEAVNFTLSTSYVLDRRGSWTTAYGVYAVATQDGKFPRRPWPVSAWALTVFAKAKTGREIVIAAV